MGFDNNQQNQMGVEQPNWGGNVMPNGYGMWVTPPQPNNQGNTNFTSFRQAPPQPKFQTIPCRVIGPGEQILAKDVPMDTPSLFLASDGSFIIGKEWTDKGGIEDTVFLPVQKDQEQKNNGMPSEEFTQIMARLDALTDMVEILQDRNKFKPNTNKYVNKNHNKKPIESEVVE